MSRLEIVSLYIACANQNAALIETDSDGILAKGYIVDEVMMTDKDFYDDDGRVARLKEWQSLVQTNSKADCIYQHTGEVSSRVFWRIQCGDVMWESTHPSFRPVDPVKDVAVYQNWYNWIVIPSRLRDTIYNKDVGNFNSVYWPSVLGRRFIVIRNEYFALAPNSTMKGDFIAILACGKVTYLLRKVMEPIARRSVL